MLTTLSPSSTTLQHRYEAFSLLQKQRLGTQLLTALTLQHIYRQLLVEHWHERGLTIYHRHQLCPIKLVNQPEWPFVEVTCAFLAIPLAAALQLATLPEDASRISLIREVTGPTRRLTMLINAHGAVLQPWLATFKHPEKHRRSDVERRWHHLILTNSVKVGRQHFQAENTRKWSLAMTSTYLQVLGLQPEDMATQALAHLRALSVPA